MSPVPSRSSLDLLPVFVPFATLDGKLRDELLDREIFYTLTEVQVLTEQYRQVYNRIVSHSALGYRPPAPQAILPSSLTPVLVGLT